MRYGNWSMFCHGCGMPFCSKCGTEINETGNACPVCHYTIRGTGERVLELTYDRYRIEPAKIEVFVRVQGSGVSREAHEPTKE